VERFHQTLNAILGKTVAEHQKDWDTRLVFALSAYRATRHRATGYSPNFLVLGRETLLRRMSSTGDRKPETTTTRLWNKPEVIWCKHMTAYASSYSEAQATINVTTTLASDQAGLRLDNGCGTLTHANYRESK